MKIKIGERECTVRLSENILHASQNYEVARHCNADFELFLILEGECVMDIEGGTEKLCRGDALLIAPSNFHSPINVSDNLVNFIIPFDFKDDDTPLFRIACPYVRLKMSELSGRLCENMLSAMMGGGVYLDGIIEASCTLILSELFSLLEPPKSKTRTTDERENDKRLAAIDNFFENYRTSYGTEGELAKLLHLSRRQLSRVLLSSYGMSFREKLARAKMDHATQLLRTTDMTAVRIAEEVGYLSVTSFYKAFKSRHNMSPLEYRRKHKKEK